MKLFSDNSYIKSTKAKVIITFVLACGAFILAWNDSKIAFREVLTTVEDISAPDGKLRIVNDLYRDIMRLDQLQSGKSLQTQERSGGNFLKPSKKIRFAIDSLRMLYKQQPEQVKLLDSIKRLLIKRDKLFVSYLKVREGLVNGKELTIQLDSLSGLISKSSAEVDSTVVTTEKKKLTTTIVSADSGAKHETGFFNRLFSGKKNKRNIPDSNLINEEINIKIDTISIASQKNVIRRMEKAVENLEKNQRQRQKSFINRELELANAGNVLVNQMLVILQQVEREGIKQADINNRRAKTVVNSGIERISTIMLCFILISAILVYLILTDISKSNTARKQIESARDEAEYHNMAKQRFLANMSHEIRTPLQSIIGYAELIKHQDQPVKNDIETIYQSSQHLLHLVNEVLDYSHIISGKFRFERSIFNINELLNEVIAAMTPQAETKSLQLQLHNNTMDPEFIIGDPFRLKQILFNLLTNAIKFTARGSISLTVSNANNGKFSSFIFAVKDTGPGIARDDIDRVFNEFEQTDSSSLASSNGTGLGLSIVKALTEGQNGEVWIESNVGKGSCFYVKLRYKSAEKPAGYIDHTINPLSFKGKVWLVDDDRFILEFCSSVFQKYQIEHSCFHFPKDILTEQWDETVSAVLMDMRMPEINGAELCRLLRSRIPKHVKIYAVTAQALPEEREIILQQGFDGLLMKPFKEAELISLLLSESSEPVENPELKIDLSALEKMTFGDKVQLGKILDRFIEDTKDDIQRIQASVSESNIKSLSLLLHRVAGRTAQVGAKELAMRFRAEEIAVEKTEVLNDEKKATIIAYANELNFLVEGIQKVRNIN
jgi:signal transduction histidine kinase/CheY-like chemotaxis protein